MICYIINGRNCKNNLFGRSSDPGNRQVKVRVWGLPVSLQDSALLFLANIYALV